MASIKENIEIKCPLDKVFAYTTVAENWPQWQSIIREANQTSSGHWSPGTTFRGVSHMLGLNMKWTARATQYEPNKAWSKDITCGPMFIAERVSYEPSGTGVKFTIAYNLRFGLFWLFSPLIVRSMGRETKKSLSTLKTILEMQP
jgi:uncharacterized membrane protein